VSFLKSKPTGPVRLLSLAALLVLALPARAATLSYFLDLANALPGGPHFLQVTISDSTTVAGDIDFRVELLPDAFPPAGGNFGMDRFLFNHAAKLSLSAANITGLNTGWRVAENRSAGGGFDRYAFQLMGNGSHRTSLLTFSITGVEGDSPESYATAAQGLHNSATQFFAAHVGGFDNQPYGVTSTWLAGSAPVPLPAAVWAFASGLLGIMTLGRRRSIG
jgi:hypothetical protein